LRGYLNFRLESLKWDFSFVYYCKSTRITMARTIFMTFPQEMQPHRPLQSAEHAPASHCFLMLILITCHDIYKHLLNLFGGHSLVLILLLLPISRSLIAWSIYDLMWGNVNACRAQLIHPSLMSIIWTLTNNWRN